MKTRYGNLVQGSTYLYNPAKKDDTLGRKGQKCRITMIGDGSPVKCLVTFEDETKFNVPWHALKTVKNG